MALLRSNFNRSAFKWSPQISCSSHGARPTADCNYKVNNLRLISINIINSLIHFKIRNKFVHGLKWRRSSPGALNNPLYVHLDCWYSLSSISGRDGELAWTSRLQDNPAHSACETSQNAQKTSRLKAFSRLRLSRSSKLDCNLSLLGSSCLSSGLAHVRSKAVSGSYRRCQDLIKGTFDSRQQSTA
jgi:hypothetical protein